MNYETRCVKIKLKPNSIEKVREWARAINERKDEALATLRDEDVILETIFLDRTSEDDFLIYVMKAENFDNAKAVLKNRFTRLTNITKISNAKLGRAAKNLKCLLI